MVSPFLVLIISDLGAEREGPNIYRMFLPGLKIAILFPDVPVVFAKYM